MNAVIGRSTYRIFAALTGCLIFALAYVNRTTFPFPWNDEARFYLPALWWAKHFSLSPINLHAPHGIFWVPDGFTIFIGLVLLCFGSTMHMARAACELAVALGVTSFAFAFRKLGGSWQAGALTTLILLTPPAVFAANAVRPEAPIFLLLALALLLHTHGRFVVAAALLAGSLLFHPALGLAAIGYAALIMSTSGKEGSKCSISKVEGVVVALIAIAVLAEFLRIVHHWSLFEAHMAFQIRRKLHSSLSAKLIKPQGLILLISSITVAILFVRRHFHLRPEPLRDTVPVAWIALAILLYAVLGNEMAYDVYSLSVCPALVFCLICRTRLEVESSGCRRRDSNSQPLALPDRI